VKGPSPYVEIRMTRNQAEYLLEAIRNAHAGTKYIAQRNLILRALRDNANGKAYHPTGEET